MDVTKVVALAGWFTLVSCVAVFGSMLIKLDLVKTVSNYITKYLTVISWIYVFACVSGFVFTFFVAGLAIKDPSRMALYLDNTLGTFWTNLWKY